MTFNLDVEKPINVFDNTFVQKGKIFADMHYEVEIGVVFEGMIRRHYSDYSRELSAGNIWLTGIWENHALEVLEPSTRLLTVVISPEFLAQNPIGSVGSGSLLSPFVVEPAKRPFSCPESGSIRRIGENIANAMERNSAYREAWLKVLVLELLLLVCENWQETQEPSSPTESFFSINRALKLLFSSKQYLSVGEAADSCGMSRRSFERKFKATMGISFAKFALRYRLSGVAERLRNSDEAIKTIAIDWGFVDTSHLDHLFRKFYGCCPGEYRSASHS